MRGPSITPGRESSYFCYDDFLVIGLHANASCVRLFICRRPVLQVLYTIV